VPCGPSNHVRRASLLRRGTIRAGIAALWLIAPVAVPVAQACVCDASPPCFAAWQADAVFVGTVVNEVREPLGGSLTWRVHNVAITQKLRGSVDDAVTMVSGDQPTPAQIAQAISAGAVGFAGSDCDYGFLAGGRYLIYARRTGNGRWTTSRCSGTKPLALAGQDLDYFASLPAAEPLGRVYGLIERYVIDPSDRAKSRRIPAAGVAVALSSQSNRVTVTTDVEGKVEARVPPGEYTIAPVVPDTVRAYGAPLQRRVAARGCAPVYFSLIADGRIEGSVLEENGGPVAHADVDVIPADLPADERPLDVMIAPSRSTDENGRFAIDGICPVVT